MVQVASKECNVAVMIRANMMIGQLSGEFVSHKSYNIGETK